MGMFDLTSAPGGAAMLIVSFLDPSYTMKPGETQTPPIRVHVNAVKADRSGALGYTGQVTLSAQGEVTRLVSSPIISLVGGAGDGVVQFTNLNANFADARGRLAVGLQAYDYANGIGGGSPSYIIQLAEAPAPVTHVLEVYNQGQIQGRLNFSGAPDIRMVLDGKMIFPPSIF